MMDTRAKTRRLAVSSCAALGMALLAGCATAGPTERVDERVTARLAAFEPTGDVRRCIPLRQIRSMDAADERTLLIELGVGDFYVSRTRSRCSGVTQSFNRIQYTTSQSQICTGDIVRIVDNSTGFGVGNCSFGEFESLRRKTEDEDPA